MGKVRSASAIPGSYQGVALAFTTSVFLQGSPFVRPKINFLVVDWREGISWGFLLLGVFGGW